MDEVGAADKEELKTMIDVLNGVITNEEALNEYIASVHKSFDQNEDNFLQFDEFLDCLGEFYAMFKLRPPSKEEAKKWFNSVDTNHDDKLTKEEFKPVVLKYLKMTIATYRKMYDEP